MSLASQTDTSKQEERDTSANGSFAFNTAEWREALESTEKERHCVQTSSNIATKPEKRLHISNIDYAVHENLLSKFLSSKFGVRVAHCKIIRNAFNNESKVTRKINFIHECQESETNSN